VSNGEVGTSVIEARDGDSGFEAQTKYSDSPLRSGRGAEATSNKL